jgi:hypothetical protein
MPSDARQQWCNGASGHHDFHNYNKKGKIDRGSLRFGRMENGVNQ